MKSRDNEQLAGKYLKVTELTDCDPIIKVQDLWLNQKKSVSDRELDDSEPAIPCGLVAKSYFNDTFELYKKGKNGAADIKIDIIEKNIAWSSDIQYKFANVKNVPQSDGVKDWRDVQWLDMTEGKYAYLI